LRVQIGIEIEDRGTPKIDIEIETEIEDKERYEDQDRG
jgi:hypothetical protein